MARQRFEDDDRDELSPWGGGISVAMIAAVAAALVFAVVAAVGVWLVFSGRQAVLQDEQAQVVVAERAPVAPVEAAPTKADPGPLSPWATAPDESATVGPVSATITSARVGRVSVEGDAPEPEEGEVLQLAIAIKNQSADQKIDYRPLWDSYSFAQGRATVSDNIGNKYKMVLSHYGRRVVGRAEGTSLYPGKSVTDLLTFQRPAEAANTLDVELSAMCVGGKGTFRIRVPKAFWDRPTR